MPTILGAILLMLSAGEPLPKLQGDYLSKRKASLPDDAKGKTAMLAFGFSYDSRFAVEAWVKAWDKKHKDDPKFTYFEIPMIGGMARLGAPFIDGGMRRGTPKELHENVITVHGGVDPWKKRFGVQSEREAYIVIIDPEGKVQSMAHGLAPPVNFRSRPSGF